MGLKEQTAGKIIDTGIDAFNYLTKGKKPKVSPGQLSKGSQSKVIPLDPRYPSIPYRDPKLYNSTDDVMNAFVEGKLYSADAAELLTNKFNIKSLVSNYNRPTGEQVVKLNSAGWTPFLNNFLKNNPKANQLYKVNFLEKIIHPATGNLVSAQQKHLANKLINKAMDKNYLSDSPEIKKIIDEGGNDFIYKFINAYKDEVLGPTANFSDGFPSGLNNIRY